MQNPTPTQGEKCEKNIANRTGIQRHRKTELVQLNPDHIYFKGDTPEVGAVLGLMSEKLDIGTDFDKFREKQKGYTERNFDNTKEIMCVVTE